MSIENLIHPQRHVTEVTEVTLSDPAITQTRLRFYACPGYQQV